MKLLVIRPEPGNTRTVNAAHMAGLEVLGCPLFEAHPVPWQLTDAGVYDALLVGSANVFRHGGEGLEALKHLPVYAVGKTTAKAAEEAGFQVAALGQGGLQAVLPMLESDGRVRAMKLAGREHVALSPTVTQIDTHIVYEVARHDLPKDVAEKLDENWAVALHSAESAKHFRNQCLVCGINLSDLTLLSFGPRISGAAGEGWKAIHTANAPTDDDMLALAIRICQKAAP